MKIFKKEYLLVILSTIILFCSFQFNLFKVADRDWFNSFQIDSESLVIGGILESKKNGYWSHGGELGRSLKSAYNMDAVNYLYDTYKSNTLPEGNFTRYTASFGIQRFIYSVVDDLLELFNITDGETKYEILTSFTALLTAFVISLFCLFIYQYAGVLPVVIFVYLTAYSEWLVVFSRNLYWIPFLTIIPFVLTSLLLMKDESSDKKYSFHKIGILLAVALYIKCLAGYEYISTILVSAMVPFLFFAIKNKWQLIDFIKRGLLVSFYAILGFLSAIATNLIQLTIILGGSNKAFNVLLFNILKRTHAQADPSMFKSSLLISSLNANTSDVVMRYLEEYSFGTIILALVVISILNTLLLIKKEHKEKYVRMNFAFLGMLWLSILAPLSWYVLAKGHSYVHPHINYVLWYFPFLLIGFAYVGFFFKTLFLTFAKGNNKILSFAILILGIGIFVYNQRNKSEFQNNTNDIAILNNANIKLGINEAENKIVYTSKDCSDNLSTRFFLHLMPIKVNFLPEAHKKFKFVNMDFSWKDTQFYSKNIIFNDYCVAYQMLPHVNTP